MSNNSKQLQKLNEDSDSEFEDSDSEDSEDIDYKKLYEEKCKEMEKIVWYYTKDNMEKDVKVITSGFPNRKFTDEEIEVIEEELKNNFECPCLDYIGEIIDDGHLFRAF